MSFYTSEELKKIGFKNFGENIKISKKCSIYSPESIEIGNNVRIDDFCLLSGGEKGIKIGSNIHIAAFSAIYGEGGVLLEDFCTLSSRVILYSLTDDYSGLSMTNPTVPKEYTGVIKAPITISKHVIIGTNSTVLPNVVIGEGSAIGAHSLVTKNINSWGIYAGIPAKKIKDRSKVLLNKELKMLKMK
ncbi:acyltransferase [Cytobacillus solani]|uniref:acyltransferase n=1 Tax=Cytobacillus solani TaxID=1637975 RepID=UPI00114E114B|nr:acyltransferase [Cytobacillus solani]